MKKAMMSQGLCVLIGCVLAACETEKSPQTQQLEQEKAVMAVSQTEAATIRNLQTNVSYTDLQAAFNDLPAVFTKSYEINISGRINSPNVSLQNKNMGVYYLKIKGINGVAVLDAQDKESALVFNGSGSTALIQNIILENLELVNYSKTSQATAAVRFITVKGKNFLRNVLFGGGFVAMRATDKCGDITLEDVQMKGILYGGPRFGLPVSAGQEDVGNVVFRRLKTIHNPQSPFTNDNVCQLKGFKSLIIEDCVFEGAAKSILDLYEMSDVSIRRNKFIQAGRTNVYGAAILIEPALNGTCNNVLIENNLFEQNKNSCLYVTGTTNLRVNNNTFIENTTASSCLRLDRTAIFAEHFNNLYYGLSTNNQPIINFYQVTGALLAGHSNYNLYYRPAGNSRSLLSGSVGTLNLNIVNLANFGVYGWDLKSLVDLPVFIGSSDLSRPPYMLKASSIGRNKGYRPKYGAKDLAGKFADGDPDIGAYDYDGL
jgi:hypothetical protein